MSQTKSHATPIGVQKYLKGADYPARKEDLLATARGNAAPQEVMEALQRLPGDQFNGPDDVMRAYGQEREDTVRMVEFILWFGPLRRDAHGTRLGGRSTDRNAGTTGWLRRSRR
jgi:hypothetical protein